MILDNQTNKVYLAEGIKSYSAFAYNLIEALHSEGVDYGWIPETGRRELIWARDYMPVQLEKNLFLQYRYSPDYLAGYPRYIPRYKAICRKINISCISTDIVLDGGNVIKCGDKVIMTDKIFKENPSYDRAKLTGKLESLFSAELVFIPWDRYEMFGHADGMVRYIGGNRVLLNNYINFDRSLRQRLLDALSRHFDVAELDYPVPRRSPLSWAFLNFLQVKGCVFVPMLRIDEQHHAESQIQAAFPDCRVRFVAGAEDIVKEGGALNCISWNILADEPEEPQVEAEYA